MENTINMTTQMNEKVPTPQVEATSIPNKAFDMEYSTQMKREMLYLKEHGFEPCFVKKTQTYHVPTYKYTKTPELFRCVAEFYELRKRDRLVSLNSDHSESEAAVTIDAVIE